MLLGFLTNMENEACAWVNLVFALMQKGTSGHILCGGELLSRVMNMLLYSLEMHITMVGYVCGLVMNWACPFFEHSNGALFSHNFTHFLVCLSLLLGHCQGL